MSEVAEQAADVVEEAVDGVVETLEVVRTNPVLLVVVGVAGIVAGGAGGYFLAKKKLERVYEDLAAAEIAEAKEFYASVNKVDVDGSVLTPQQVLEKRHPEAADALRSYQGRHDAIDDIQNSPAVMSESEAISGAKDEQGGPWDDEMDEEQLQKLEARLLAERPDAIVETKTEKVEVTTEVRNVFEDPTFDLEEEKKSRTKARPYVISHDEYFAADLDYENISLTYYEEDDTLVNEQDNPVQQIDQMIGDEALGRFGHGSKDKNVVYVRNDRLETDFEVVRSNGSYVVEVLGLEPAEPNSLKHSDQRDRRRAFRHGDG